MIALLAVRNLVLKPWRSAFLLFGYSLGVAVMIVLLSIGEALLSQSRDEKLVGGGEVTVLPEGIDVEVMKTGGLGGLFSRSITHDSSTDNSSLHHDWRARSLSLRRRSKGSCCMRGQPAGARSR